MVRIISSPNRGNSPKMGFLKNFHIAFAKGDRKFITKSVTDTFVLDMIGDKKFEGKEKFVEELKNIPAHKISQLTLDKILSYAVNGMMKLENGKTYACFKDIAELWQRFMSGNTLSKIPNKVNNEIYSLYTDYEGDHTKPYTAISGCKVERLDNIPNGMVGKSFSGGKYVKTMVKGDLIKGLIVNHWSKIFKMDLDRNHIADFEVFGEKAQNTSDAEVDFHVGIK